MACALVREAIFPKKEVTHCDMLYNAKVTSLSDPVCTLWAAAELEKHA